MKQLNRIKVVLVEKIKPPNGCLNRLARIPVRCLVAVQIIPSQTLKLCFRLQDILNVAMRELIYVENN